MAPIFSICIITYYSKLTTVNDKLYINNIVRDAISFFLGSIKSNCGGGHRTIILLCRWKSKSVKMRIVINIIYTARYARFKITDFIPSTTIQYYFFFFLVYI